MTGRNALLWLGAVAFFATALAWLEGVRPRAHQDFPPGSIYSRAPEGLSLAYGYLGGRAAPLTRSLGLEVADGVAFRVRPAGAPLLPPSRDANGEDDVPTRPKPALLPASLLTGPEEEWIRRGGRLVLALADRHGPVSVASGDALTGARKVYPLWPGVERLAPQPPRMLAGPALREAHAMFVTGSQPLLARQPMGRGELILLACPEILENRLIAEADHLALLLALAEEPRQVYFDEYVHGLRSQAGLLELMGRWGLGPVLVLLALTGALAFWRARVRLGPEQDEYEETRADAVELLDSLAPLYDRALRRDEALALYRDALGRAVTARTGARGAALADQLDALAGIPLRAHRDGKQDVSLVEFQRGLRSLGEAFRRLRHAEPG